MKDRKKKSDKKPLLLWRCLLRLVCWFVLIATFPCLDRVRPLFLFARCLTFHRDLAWFDLLFLYDDACSGYFFYTV